VVELPEEIQVRELLDGLYVLQELPGCLVALDLLRHDEAKHPGLASDLISITGRSYRLKDRAGEKELAPKEKTAGNRTEKDATRKDQA
jgi:hypothetical protein